MRRQLDLFGAGPPLPEGFRYRAELIPVERERDLLARAQDLPLEEFRFRGYTGKRRVVSFGARYDFEDGALREAEAIPEYLLPLRDAAAAFADLPPRDLRQVLVTEYPPGAAIGWHRDRDVFGDVIGVSLLAPCVFRLRRKKDEGWERVSLEAEPRSAYLLSGPARTEWEHSIPPVPELRYSVTFRTLRPGTG